MILRRPRMKLFPTHMLRHVRAQCLRNTQVNQRHSQFQSRDQPGNIVVCCASEITPQKNREIVAIDLAVCQHVTIMMFRPIWRGPMDSRGPIHGLIKWQSLERSQRIVMTEMSQCTIRRQQFTCEMNGICNSVGTGVPRFSFLGLTPDE